MHCTSCSLLLKTLRRPRNCDKIHAHRSRNDPTGENDASLITTELNPIPPSPVPPSLVDREESYKASVGKGWNTSLGTELREEAAECKPRLSSLVWRLSSRFDEPGCHSPSDKPESNRHFIGKPRGVLGAFMLQRNPFSLRTLPTSLL